MLAPDSETDMSDAEGSEEGVRMGSNAEGWDFSAQSGIFGPERREVGQGRDGMEREMGIRAGWLVDGKRHGAVRVTMEESCGFRKSQSGETSEEEYGK